MLKGNTRALRGYNVWFNESWGYNLKHELRTGKSRRWGVSYRFVSTDFRLLALFWLVELDVMARRFAWCQGQHCCSCYHCTIHKRKWNGNAEKSRPIQERRERLASDSWLAV